MGKRYGYGIYRNTVDNATYKGQWLDDLLEGFTEIYWDDGARFQGIMKASRMVSGEFIFTSGNQFIGCFSNHGMLEGQGVMKTDFEIIEGCWKDSKLNGNATRRTNIGDEYTGEWINGKLNGKGYYKTKEESYAGQFKDNVEHGMGKKDFSNGSWYHGHWKDGEPHGVGTCFKFGTNSMYTGEFFEGKK